MGATSARGTGRLLAVLAAATFLTACTGTTGKGIGGSGSSLSLAGKAMSAGDYGTAASLYQQAFDANPRSVDPLIGLGRSYTGLGQYSRAEQALLEANVRKPRNPEILLELSRTQLASGKPQAALANLETAERNVSDRSGKRHGEHPSA
jgi:cytochrome c-type biogenesis protein CcmH/NrfG